MTTSQNNNIKIGNGQIAFFFSAIISILISGAILFLDTTIPIKLVLMIFVGLLPVFFLKPTFYLYFIFLITPSLRVISTEDTIFNVGTLAINFNAIIDLSIVIFGLVLFINNRQAIWTKIKSYKFINAFFIFLILASISIFYSIYQSNTLQELVRVYGIFVIFLASFLVIKNKKQAYSLLTAMIVGAIIPSAIGLWQLYTGAGWYDNTMHQNRIFGTLLHPATFSFFLLALLPIAYSIGQARKNNKVVYTFYYLVMALFSFLIFATFTRGAWAALLVMLIAYGIFKNFKILLAGFLMILIAYLASDTVSQRIDDVFQPAYNSSFSTRVNILSRTAPAFWESPFFGQGFGSFERVNLKYNKEAIYYESLAAHNDYLRIIIELGVVGLIIYLSIFGFLLLYLFKLYFKTRDEELKNHIFSLGILLIGGLTISAGDNFLRTMPVQYIMWSYVGITLYFIENGKKVQSL